MEWRGPSTACAHHGHHHHQRDAFGCRSTIWNEREGAAREAGLACNNS
jgi:hypothetical protein